MTSGTSSNDVRQAVILAGGEATRLRPYTDDRPKPLVDIGGATLFEHQVTWLAAGGVTDVVVACGYRADVFNEFVRNTELPVRVEILVEDAPLGRGGGLKFAARSLPFQDERWLGLNGDVLTDASLRDIDEEHVSRRAAATIAVAAYRCPYGVLDINDTHQVERFVESPVLPIWINAGIYVFEPGIADLLPDNGDHERSTFPALASEGRLFAYKISGNWRGIDTIKDLQDAKKRVELHYAKA